LGPKTYEGRDDLTEPREPGVVRRSAPGWSIVEVDDVLHVELGGGIRTSDLEEILDALGSFSHGFTTSSEIVFHRPNVPLSSVATAFLSVVADTIRRNGVEIRIDPDL